MAIPTITCACLLKWFFWVMCHSGPLHMCIITCIYSSMVFGSMWPPTFSIMVGNGAATTTTTITSSVACTCWMISRNIPIRSLDYNGLDPNFPSNPFLVDGWFMNEIYCYTIYGRQCHLLFALVTHYSHICWKNNEIHSRMLYPCVILNSKWH